MMQVTLGLYGVLYIVTISTQTKTSTDYTDLHDLTLGPCADLTQTFCTDLAQTSCTDPPNTMAKVLEQIASCLAEEMGVKSTDKGRMKLCSALARKVLAIAKPPKAKRAQTPNNKFYAYICSCRRAATGYAYGEDDPHNGEEDAENLALITDQWKSLVKGKKGFSLPKDAPEKAGATLQAKWSQHFSDFGGQSFLTFESFITSGIKETYTTHPKDGSKGLVKERIKPAMTMAFILGACAPCIQPPVPPTQKEEEEEEEEGEEEE
jgi:hypothetical protein